jgi:hypothetical protein
MVKTRSIARNRLDKMRTMRHCGSRFAASRSAVPAGRSFYAGGAFTMPGIPGRGTHGRARQNRQYRALPAAAFDRLHSVLVTISNVKAG